MPPAAPPPPLLRPRALVKGDAIGVVTPSYTPKAPWLLRGVKSLEHAGFEVVLDPEITDSRRFKRVDDERRAENFMSGWLDPRVKAVVAATGGYGATRMIPHLEADVFRKNPEAVRRLLRRHRAAPLDDEARGTPHLPRPHGGRPDPHDARRDDGVVHRVAHVRRAPPRSSARGSRAWCGKGTATGRLTGGNLSLVQQSIGTPYEVDTRDAILFLEETRDPMSVLDERIVHLRAAGLLKRVQRYRDRPAADRPLRGR